MIGRRHLPTLALVLLSRTAQAQEVRHTVKANETCAAIATQYYGDSRLVDVIHKANPALGSKPPPHHLEEGTVLIIPPRPSTSTAPDAQLTTVRNRVEVLTPQPAPGKPNDPLFRGNRVSTQESSAADVTFRDETQVKLSERTLVIILGDVRSAAKTEAQTSLVTGSLRAWMAGPRKDAAAGVTTPAANVRVWNGEAQVSVVNPKPADKTTRLAVYSGSSTITAQSKTQEVTRGFGSKAELGKPPTPPRALPAAPEWTVLPPTLLVDSIGNGAAIIGEYDLPAGSATRIKEWRVQVAHESGFKDIERDERAPFDTKRAIVQAPGPGHYFIRVSAIDDDHFEGPFSRPVRALVIRPVITQREDGRRRVTIEPPNAPCMRVGNSRLTWVKSPIDALKDEPIRLRCAPTETTPTTLVSLD